MSEISDAAALRAEVRAALAEVRREEFKAALVYGAVDAAVVGALVGLVGTLVDLGTVAGVGETVVDLGAVAGPLLGSQAAALPTVRVSLTTGATVGASLLVLLAELVYRTRGAPCERFEAATVDIDPALRTARDASETGREEPMAAMLYSQVLADLKRANSADLVRVRRLVSPLLIAVMVALVTVQLAAADFEVTTDVGPQPGPGPSGTADGGLPEDTTIKDGDAVLGNATNVSSGNETLNTTISAGAAGEDRPRDVTASGGLPSGAGPNDIDARRAGFSEREDVEDAQLIKDYNVAARNEQDDD